MTHMWQFMTHMWQFMTHLWQFMTHCYNIWHVMVDMLWHIQTNHIGGELPCYAGRIYQDLSKPPKILLDHPSTDRFGKKREREKEGGLIIEENTTCSVGVIRIGCCLTTHWLKYTYWYSVHYTHCKCILNTGCVIHVRQSRQCAYSVGFVFNTVPTSLNFK